MKPANYKVLVVDDDESMRSLIVKLLSTPGHICVTAINGDDALDKMRGNRFDAVITDIVMPGKDGIVLTRDLSERDPNLPIMVLTGHGELFSSATAVAAGAREFIEKPFSVVEFVVRFHKMMGECNLFSGMASGKNEVLTDLREEPDAKVEGFGSTELLPNELTLLEEPLNSLAP